ncbi:hypothetical protein SAMN05660909_03246 [Chitinophaga terrae (ex Kim and Jung 2007)]|jgi:lipid-A-disaccharide synthase-like uncharacterized protein|uniref:Uncharacterized protein n=1 Tax=Chitinophaga terrae (ex Kim and Jung 2007) TaxID=408074 RepID=A0A1H4DPZ6_9BACT|nr:hypothetical protein [Chitinophaga terrae (ex Kim and Jung 2007)]MDQ0107873.1 lipid-A-disaccharide synthase-like uncharacterized protein [Chitinophaga terrae (ex Kim and Jung 2007)]GEP91044.1 hypothetical protein CTE07_26890 [Chitinophaga terrae (ex Kim and Jung 2007)]SEA74500.1 hypothetical protein SAMN05660909_03246 [Chitinophaga terrae (ex Kim and Jung 2007)]
MLKKDNLQLGIVLGLLTPLVMFLGYYYFVIKPHNNVSFVQFLGILKDNRQMIPKLVSICLLLNGVVFYLYTRERLDVTAKGIFLVTMLYAICILLLKLIN